MAVVFVCALVLILIVAVVAVARIIYDGKVALGKAIEHEVVARFDRIKRGE